jgi:hypothetical protein
MIYLLDLAIVKPRLRVWLLIAVPAFAALIFDYLMTLVLLGLATFLVRSRRRKRNALALGLERQALPACWNIRCSPAGWPPVFPGRPLGRSEEPIADSQPIQRASDVAPGANELSAGFYDRPTQQRVRLPAGGDAFRWPQTIAITAPL